MNAAPRPEPDAGEGLIRVRAAGIHPVDWKVREGHSMILPGTCLLIPEWFAFMQFSLA